MVGVKEREREKRKTEREEEGSEATEQTALSSG